MIDIPRPLFQTSILHFNRNRSSSFFNVVGDLPAREAPGISSSVSPLAAIRDSQDTRKSLAPRPRFRATRPGQVFFSGFFFQLPSLSILPSLR